MHRRHPSPLELGAYFDGEPIEGVGEHVARCHKCRESLEELPGGQASTRAAGRPASPPAAGSASVAAAPSGGPLRIGVPVPTRGPSAGEGDEVLRAVKAVVDQANKSGGAAGRRVELVEVPTDD